MNQKARNIQHEIRVGLIVLNDNTSDSIYTVGTENRISVGNDVVTYHKAGEQARRKILNANACVISVRNIPTIA